MVCTICECVLIRNMLKSFHLQIYLHFVSFHWYKRRQTLTHVVFMSHCWMTSWGDKLKQGSLIFCASLWWCVFNANHPEHCPGKTKQNTVFTSAWLSEHTANIVSKLSFWQEYEVICLCSTSIFHSCCQSSAVVLSSKSRFPQQPWFVVTWFVRFIDI